MPISGRHIHVSNVSYFGALTIVRFWLDMREYAKRGSEYHEAVWEVYTVSITCCVKDICNVRVQNDGLR